MVRCRIANKGNTSLTETQINLKYNLKPLRQINKLLARQTNKKQVFVILWEK